MPHLSQRLQPIFNPYKMCLCFFYGLFELHFSVSWRELTQSSDGQNVFCLKNICPEKMSSPSRKCMCEEYEERCVIQKFSLCVASWRNIFTRLLIVTSFPFSWKTATRGHRDFLNDQLIRRSIQSIGSGGAYKYRHVFPCSQHTAWCLHNIVCPLTE